MEPLAEPRFPAVAGDEGFYESWYLKAGEPGGTRAVWIRYTVHKRPGHRPEGSVWFTLFDAGAGRPEAVKQTGAEGALGVGRDRFLEVDGLGTFTPDRAEGRAAGEGREASWQLAISNGESRLEHLPAWLYGSAFPRTKLLTVRPAALFSGSVEIGDTRIELEEWPGMIGHNWGTRHAERWVWLHGTDFAGRKPDTWIDLAFGQIRLGRWTTPWVLNGALSLDGRRHRLGGFIGSLRAGRVEAAAGSCRFRLSGRGVAVSGTVTAPVKDTVAWAYADPDGSQHHTLNCSISGLELEVAGLGPAPIVLETAAGAAYEYGSRDFAHGIPVEPFTDG